MKKIFTLALLAILGMGNAFAGDVTFVPSDFTATDSKDFSLTKDGVTVEVKASTVNADQIRIYKGKTITISSTVGNITQVVFTCTAEGTAKYGPGCFEDATAGSYSYDAAVGTWTGDAPEFTLTAKSNQVRATQIVVTIAEGGQVQTKTATSIQFADGYQTNIAGGPDGMFPEIGHSVALPIATVMAGENAVAGASIDWSLEVKSWKEGKAEPTISEGKVNFVDGTYGEITIKAAYAGNDSYKESSKTYTLKVHNAYGLLSEMVNDIVDSDYSKDDSSDDTGSLTFYFFRNIDADGFPPVKNTVTYVNGKYIYLTDGQNNLLFYGTNSQNLKAGDVISGNVSETNLGGFWGVLKRYNKLPEFAFTDMNVKVEEEGAAPEPTTIAADALKDYINIFVKIEDAVFVSADKKNLTFNVGENELKVYNQFNVDVETLTVGATYTLTGLGAVYKTKQATDPTFQLYLDSFVKTAETGINTVKTAATQNGAIYNIAGQKVSASYKGLVIKNGKKIVQK